ncbi:6-hydroxymethylpterin diphosphokinase MptE-like protein [Alteromonas sp. BMJM2]|uniref:6-hydroxymethylpterin diphosphokinase MptE-like protein n=1 Tax=Alteromonas sp. BMJM2 TaxID=2954241 RepID=UPI0022B580B2|nr:6-hydroxymethylpterin diphosphokinase MptE-like protein [Alteromonas sp. BMJM2]
MLKNIRLHIDKNEEQQTRVEQATAASIDSQFKKNLLAFRAHIPSIVDQIQTIRNDNISIFCNKHGQFNIVDYGVGRTFYGLEPEKEIKSQYLNFTKHAISVSMDSVAKVANEDDCSDQLAKVCADSGYSKRDALPAKIETMVVLGIGIGLHIVELLKHYHIENLVVYEPEMQYFKCSAYCNQWDEALTKAQEKGTRLFFQLGKDGSHLIADIDELHQHFGFSRFYVYKHYNTPVFNSIEQACSQSDWLQIKRGALSFKTPSTPSEFIPLWTQSLNIDAYQSPGEQAQEQRTKNLQAFKKYFPDIYKTFADYEPQIWLPVEGDNGEINILHKQSLVPWYGESPSQECILNFDNFSEQPNKDGLILGYNGRKLKKYLHYQFVSKTESLLKDVEQEEGGLPETIKSLILFGVGVGYQIERLFKQHHVEKLFICEPNKDFFHGSLFAIKWDEILADIDEQEGRLYINIGDDGTNLFKDLLSQFYSIGPYILANTYFYQSYYNSVLVSALAQLREQLQVVISMGEYFDHAFFGIAQTTEMLSRSTPFLRKSPAQYLSFEDKEVPVFVIGNGPSLDTAIDAIKEWRDKAIIISCGTALSALHKYKITPDFHAEIEQNRATYDWCSRVDDFDYLKQISLISVNGIHPDTCNLFKEVYIAFKDGESSTVSALEVLGRKNYEELQFAFPTVSNLAINLISKLGMQQVYLFGVDLGFYSKEKHHSQNSSYYINGKEVYDYEGTNNTSLVVPGNFRKTVFTKYEFKLSKAIIEQSLASNRLSCFNCSDGAKIVGTSPLSPEMVLIPSSSQQRDDALQAIKEHAFYVSDKQVSYREVFEQRFCKEALKKELSVFIENAKKVFTSIEQVDEFINTQKEMLFDSYQRKQSLLFFLLYGTVNYANALFSKLVSTTRDLSTIEKAQKEWIDTLNLISSAYFDNVSDFDTTSSCVYLRESVFIKRLLHSTSRTFEVSVNPEDKLITRFIEQYSVVSTQPSTPSKYHCQVVFNANSDELLSDITNSEPKNLRLLGTYGLLDAELLSLQYKTFSRTSFYLWYRAPSYQFSAFESGDVPFVHHSKQSFLPAFLCNVDDVFLFLPKYEFANSSSEQKERYLEPLLASLSWINHYIEYPKYIAVPKKGNALLQLACDNIGNRGKIMSGNVQLSSLLLEEANDARVKSLLKELTDQEGAAINS